MHVKKPCLALTNQANYCVNNSLPKHSPYMLKKGHVCNRQCRRNNILIFENLALVVGFQRPAKDARSNLAFNFFNFIV